MGWWWWGGGTGGCGGCGALAIVLLAARDTVGARDRDGYTVVDSAEYWAARAPRRHLDCLAPLAILYCHVGKRSRPNDVASPADFFHFHRRLADDARRACLIVPWSDEPWVAIGAPYTIASPTHFLSLSTTPPLPSPFHSSARPPMPSRTPPRRSSKQLVLRAPPTSTPRPPPRSSALPTPRPPPLRLPRARPEASDGSATTPPLTFSPDGPDALLDAAVTAPYNLFDTE